MGLCYYVNCSQETFSEVGCFSFQAGVDTDRVQQAIDAVQYEIQLVREKGITQKELEDAKSYLFGQMALYLEDIDNNAYYTLQKYLLYGEIQTWKDTQLKYQKVSVDDIHNIIPLLLDDMKKVSFVLGPEEIKINL